MLKTHADLCQALIDGAVLITPNNRLAAQLLQHAFGHARQSTLLKPRCHPYRAFLQACYRDFCFQHVNQRHAVLLSSTQEYALWSKLIQADHADTFSPGLCQEVQEAWKRCQQWCTDIGPSGPTLQTQQFYQWQQRFQAKLDDLGAITEDQVPAFLIKNQYLPAHSSFIWVCFDDFTPAQVALQQYLTTQGFSQQVVDHSESSASVYQYAATDQQTEENACIQWLHTRLQAGDRHIGLIVPDMADAPRWQTLLQQRLSTTQYNFSMGQALFDYPLIGHALFWLTLPEKTFSQMQWQMILTSPYIAGARREHLQRARLGQNPLFVQDTYIEWPLLEPRCKEETPLLAHCLATIQPYPETASLSEWTMHFKHRLKQLGFPGEYPLDSIQYQCLQRLDALMDEFLALGMIEPTLTRHSAIQALTTLTQQTIFQPKKAPTPIILLGLLEASGCLFDSIWICGLTDHCLPKKLQFSPFIPTKLQRQLKMPHADLSKEWRMAQTALIRIAHSCQHLILSYPRLIGDLPQLVSPLISHYPITDLPFSPPMTFTSSLQRSHMTYAIPLPENRRQKGGTSVLAYQAQCPFRAFAAHRLQARLPLKATRGLDASERGQLIHRCLEQLWRVLQSQKQLHHYSDIERATLIETIIRQTMTNNIPSRHSFSPIIQAIELKRLQQLIEASLVYEMARPAFVIEALETSYTVPIAGLELNIRIDRMDKTSDGHKWIIDYKTTLPSRKPWFEERTEHPQLLLYALLDEQINTLVFMELKLGQVQYRGLSEQTQTIPGLEPLPKGVSWATQKQQWKNQLTQLAEEFQNGICVPQPTKTSTCASCEFLSLCRHAEKN